jgi:hypothetical protein
MHFLGENPEVDTRDPAWLKWGFILTWQPRNSSTLASFTITLLVFQPPVETLTQLMQFVQSPHWTDVTLDPYALVSICLASWHQRIDEVAWEVNSTMVRADETDIFQRARTLRRTAVSALDLDLHRIHTSAKHAIFMTEAMDAAIRSVDLALSGHETLRDQVVDSRLWENTHRRLQHSGELFQSTKLRTASAQARIKNTVDLVSKHPRTGTSMSRGKRH